MSLQAENGVAQGLQDGGVLGVQAGRGGERFGGIEGHSPETGGGCGNVPLREQPPTACVQLAGAVVAGQGLARRNQVDQGGIAGRYNGRGQARLHQRL